MQSESSKAIDRVIHAGSVRLLKEQGYRKSARTFWNLSGDVFKVVNFQSSMWNTPDSARFTINLRIVHRCFHESFTGQRMPANPGSAASLAEYRIGQLMADHKDHWWVVSPDSDTDSVGKEVAALIRDLGLPFLATASDVEWIASQLAAPQRFDGYVGNQPLAAAILLHCLGRTSESRQIMEELVRMNTHKGFGKTIERIAQRIYSSHHISG